MSPIFFGFLFYIYLITVQSSKLNVGTVLFTKMDLSRPCWSAEDVALLTSRMIFEDLLPSVDVIRIDCDDFIDDIVIYFRQIIELIRAEATGRNKYVTLLALTDLLGGYLHHVVLPNARYAYYSGVIQFHSVKKLLQLFEELKWFLRTNGEGWAQRLNPHEPEIRILSGVGNKSCITNNNPSASACDRLIYYDSEPAFKRQVTDEEVNLFFPLPFFDTKHNPSAIAVPFVHYSLRNIESRKSANLIMKYYLAASNCLAEKEACKENVKQFQNNLYTWIRKDVVCKLHDEKFYAAFGGILRVEETLKSQGATEVELKGEDNKVEEGEEETGLIPGDVGSEKKKTNLILLVMLICILIWFVLGALFICYKIRSNRRAKCPGAANLDNSTRTNTHSVCDCTPKQSKFSFFPSRSGTKSCKSCCSSDRSGRSGSYTCSSDFDQKSKGRSRRQPSCPSSSLCNCDDSAAVINTSQSQKLLPSIAEINEGGGSRPKRISFSQGQSSQGLTNNKPEFRPRKGPDKRVCVPSLSSVSTKCGRTRTTDSSKSRSCGKTPMETECWCPHTNDSCSACSECCSKDKKSTSYTCNYEIVEKPRIFGYDFHTTSSETDDDDLDIESKTVTTSSTTK